MSSSSLDHLLDPTDTLKLTKTKVGKSFCEPGNLDGNIALHLFEEFLFLLEGQGKNDSDVL